MGVANRPALKMELAMTSSFITARGGALTMMKNTRDAAAPRRSSPYWQRVSSRELCHTMASPRIKNPVAVLHHQRRNLIAPVSSPDENLQPCSRILSPQRRPCPSGSRCQVATTGAADFALVEEDEEAGLLAFLTSERAKVVAMVAIAMALCNADRVVLSVAIVPMSAAHGWSQSFAGIVQVSYN